MEKSSINDSPDIKKRNMERRRTIVSTNMSKFINNNINNKEMNSALRKEEEFIQNLIGNNINERIVSSLSPSPSKAKNLNDYNKFNISNKSINNNNNRFKRKMSIFNNNLKNINYESESKYNLPNNENGLNKNKNLALNKKNEKSKRKFAEKRAD